MSTWLVGSGLAAICMGVFLTRGTRPALADESIELVVVGFADVSGGSDPACPACSGAYDDADERFALANPLGEMEFVVRNEVGQVVAVARTERLGALQTAVFTLPGYDDGNAYYELELVAPPAGWLLCFDDTPKRVIAVRDLSSGMRIDMRFYYGCERDTAQPGPTQDSTMAPTMPPATAEPPVAEATAAVTGTEPAHEAAPAEATSSAGAGQSYVYDQNAADLPGGDDTYQVQSGAESYSTAPAPLAAAVAAPQTGHSQADQPAGSVHPAVAPMLFPAAGFGLLMYPLESLAVFLCALGALGGMLAGRRRNLETSHG